MQTQQMVPVGGSLIVMDAQGNQVAQLPADQVNSYLSGQGKGSGMNWQAAGQALQAVGSALQIRAINAIRDDAKAARADLAAARFALKTYLDAGGSAASGSVFASKLNDVFTAQRDVDRAQNELMGGLIDNLVLQLAGQGMQLAGTLTGGAASMGSGPSATAVVAGIGAGALLLSVFNDDKEDEYYTDAAGRVRRVRS